jgi:anti-sigma regulatory factor (Ser/Thr protein kinase)
MVGELAPDLLGPVGSELVGVQTAVLELITNAVEHAARTSLTSGRRFAIDTTRRPVPSTRGPR